LHFSKSLKGRIMPDAKISALPSATTPLAGTEVLPIVQSSTTRQVSVANLTAGRAVSVAGLTSTSNVTLSTNATYLRGVTTGATTTRMFGINAGNVVYIGSIDTQTAGGVIFINGTEFMNVSTANNVTVSAGNLIIGTAGRGVTLPGGITWTSGSGSPEGVVTAPVGSLFSRSDGGAGTSLYVKQSGSGNTGWVGK
jgi:hypothetical protein